MQNYIWDFDGMLFDSYPHITSAFLKALAENGTLSGKFPAEVIPEKGIEINTDGAEKFHNGFHSNASLIRVKRIRQKQPPRLAAVLSV